MEEGSPIDETFVSAGVEFRGRSWALKSCELEDGSENEAYLLKTDVEECGRTRQAR